VRVVYLVQPIVQTGKIIDGLLTSNPEFQTVIFVTAFANRQTLLRFKPKALSLKSTGSLVRYIVGIDLDGTSKEALQELLSWNIDVRIVKNRRPGHTFHPKIFFCESKSQANLIIGSNNFTEGGFYKNYEAATHISFSLPDDNAELSYAKSELQRFLDPQGSTTRPLTSELLETLVARGDIPTEAEARRIRGEAIRSRRRATVDEPSPFDSEAIPLPPAMPKEALDTVLPVVRADRKQKQQQASTDESITVESSAEIAPTAFYMELHKMRVPGGSTPGEGRIPLEARDVAEEFWGWKDSYQKALGSRGGTREYWNWKPRWKIYDVTQSESSIIEEVRMYEYVNSSDFRFYSPKLVELNATEGDIIRISRLNDEDAEFECVLARRGTPIHVEWQTYCTEKVRSSKRKYGYA